METAFDDISKKAILERVYAELSQNTPKIDWQTEYFMTESEYQKHMQRINKMLLKFGLMGFILSAIFLSLTMPDSLMLVLMSYAITCLIFLVVYKLVYGILRKQMVGQMAVLHIRLNYPKQQIECLAPNNTVIQKQKFHTQVEIHAFMLPESEQEKYRQLRNTIQNKITQQTGIRFIGI